jgi:hypothetical protein
MQMRAKIMLRMTTLCLLFFLVCLNGKAQVTIGSGHTPNKAALLDINEITSVGGETVNHGGILYPRVYLLKKDQLVPFFPAADTVTTNYKTQQKPLHKGLVVYNLTNDSDDSDGEGFEEGIYYWDGEKWVRTEKGKEPSVFTVKNCNLIKVYGDYSNGVPLTTANYLSIEVEITRAGAYSISAVANSDNGYFYLSSGEFLATGDFTLIVPGMGNPIDHQTDHFTLSLNNDPHNGGSNPPCTFDVEVKDSAIRPEYQMECSATKVIGDYYEELALTSGNYIEVTLTVPMSSMGASYEITTNEVDGIKFSGKGILNTTTQIVRLNGEGTPFDTRDKKFYITSNSESSTATCVATVFMIIPAKRVMTIGYTGSNYGYNLGDIPGANRSNHSNNLLTSKENFGPHSWSIVRYAGFNNKSSNLITSAAADDGRDIVALSDDISQSISSAEFERLLFGLGNYPKMDIVIIGYNTDMFYAGTNPAAKADLLVRFLKEGGIVLMFCEQLYTNQVFLRKVFNNNNINISAGLAAGTRYTLGYEGNNEAMKATFAKRNDPILDGPFGDIYGSKVGEDASTTYYATGLPMEEVVLYASNVASGSSKITDPTAATLFRHATLPFVWSGDGGFNSSNQTNTLESICPFKLTSRVINGHTYPFYPTFRQDFGASNTYVYNAVFTANAIAWCIKTAEELRKASQ